MYQFEDRLNQESEDQIIVRFGDSVLVLVKELTQRLSLGEKLSKNELEFLEASTKFLHHGLSQAGDSE